MPATIHPMDHLPQSQPDGHAEPINPAITLTPEQRDQAIVAECYRPMLYLLFRAWQLDQLGLADGLTFNTAPQPIQDMIRRRVDQALGSVSVCRRSEAERKTKQTIVSDIESACFHYVNSILDARERYAAGEHFKSLQRNLRLGGTVNDWIWMAERELVAPLTLHPEAQIAKTLLRAAVAPMKPGGAE